MSRSVYFLCTPIEKCGEGTVGGPLCVKVSPKGQGLGAILVTYELSAAELIMRTAHLSSNTKVMSLEQVRESFPGYAREDDWVFVLPTEEDMKRFLADRATFPYDRYVLKLGDII
jgi:hypothetical protein